MMLRNAFCCLAWILCCLTESASAQTTTLDQKHNTSTIALDVVYFVPADRSPLVDWRDRVEYFCRRISKFHQREFQGQSELQINIHSEPIVSNFSTDRLRVGDVNAIFARTTDEVRDRIGFEPLSNEGPFPIVLVLSDINWQPLDDFYRLKPNGKTPEFDGQIIRGEHFPGSTRGGSRAGYRRIGMGVGLVSADGWRVPYRGSDCVIYHEGLGHTVGLPHPDKGDGSVMSQAQYRGWLSESWLNEDQKMELGWKDDANFRPSKAIQLYSAFKVEPFPKVPSPGEQVGLRMTLPPNIEIQELRVRYQTSLEAPWVEVPTSERTSPKNNQWEVLLGSFDRPTPISYRVDVVAGGEAEELWGYLQVREGPQSPPLPLHPTPDLSSSARPSTSLATLADEETDLLSELDPTKCFRQGQWRLSEGNLISPKSYGARIELPFRPDGPYRINLVVEALDAPNGLLIGHSIDGTRFVTLINHTSKGRPFSAIENVDGQNVGNETTYQGDVLRKGRLSQVIAEVTETTVRVLVDGRLIIDWEGDSESLTLSDYWSTPDSKSIFLGSYDCSYRIYRCTVEPL